MTQLEKMRAIAAAESAAARQNWDRSHPPRRQPSRVRDELRKMLGSGISHAEAGRRIGCTKSAVRSMLLREGWKL